MVVLDFTICTCVLYTLNIYSCGISEVVYLWWCMVYLCNHVVHFYVYLGGISDQVAYFHIYSHGISGFLMYIFIFSHRISGCLCRNARSPLLTLGRPQRSHQSPQANFCCESTSTLFVLLYVPFFTLVYPCITFYTPVFNSGRSQKSMEVIFCCSFT